MAISDPLAPIGPIEVTPLEPAVAGTPLGIDVTLPIARDGISVYLAVGDSVGAGICPAELLGDCLGITGGLSILGPVDTIDGVAHLEVPLVPAAPSFAVQAVLLFPRRSYQSPPLAIDVPLVIPEVCGSGADEDEDGLTDCEDPDCGAEVACIDADGDGYSPADGDCDDGDPLVSPGIEEICGDTVDNDCDGLVDTIRWYIDRDGDGHGTPEIVFESCGEVVGFSRLGDDCDDGDAGISPSAEEVCDGVDNNCIDGVDEVGAVDGVWAFYDRDGDGFGDPDAPISICGPTPGIVDNGTDCDDGEAAVYPGAPDAPYDGVDADCGGDDDFDADGDGFASDDYETMTASATPAISACWVTTSGTPTATRCRMPVTRAPFTHTRTRSTATVTADPTRATRSPVMTVSTTTAMTPRTVSIRTASGSAMQMTTSSSGSTSGDGTATTAIPRSTRTPSRSAMPGLTTTAMVAWTMMTQTST